MAIRRGELIVLPTDTVYGIAADAFSPDAVAGAARRQGPRSRDAAAGPGERGDDPRRAGRRRPGLRPRAGRGVLARRPRPSSAASSPRCSGTSARPGAPSRCACPTTRSPSPCSNAPARWPSARPTCRVARPLAPPTRPSRCSASRVEVIVDAGTTPGARDASTIVDCTGSRGPDPAAGRDLARRAQRRPRAAGRRASPTRARRAPMREYLLVFLVAGTVTYLLTVIAREIALRTGAVAEVRDRDVHTEPIPYMGGHRDARRPVRRPTSWRASCRSCPAASGFVFQRRGRRAAGRRPGLRRRACSTTSSTSTRSTKLGGQVLAAALLVVFGVRFYYFPRLRRQQPVHPRPGPGGPAERHRGDRDHQRGQLRRRARRSRGRRRRHRRGRLLPVLLRPGRRERPDPGHHRRAAHGQPRRRLCAASCRTTSTRPGSSWATPARC